MSAEIRNRPCEGRLLKPVAHARWDEQGWFTACEYPERPGPFAAFPEVCPRCRPAAVADALANPDQLVSVPASVRDVLGIDSQLIRNSQYLIAMQRLGYPEALAVRRAS